MGNLTNVATFNFCAWKQQQQQKKIQK